MPTKKRASASAPKKRGPKPIADRSAARDAAKIGVLLSERELDLLQRARDKSGYSIAEIVRDGGLRDACEELGLDWDAWYHDHEERRIETA